MTKLKLIFTLLTVLFVVSIVGAQDEPPPNDFVANDKPQNRFQLLIEELDLTEVQVVQWQKLNRDGRIRNREAQQRLNQAKEELDQLIYSDSVTEEILQSKVRSVVEAHAEITKNRAMTELSVRNILSPQQLAKFRNLRKRFKQQQRQRLLQRQRRQRRQRLNNDRRNPNLRNRPTQRNRNRPS